MRERPLPPGAVVGHYRIDELLREDPGVRTYAATDTGSSSLVTLRLLAADEPTDTEQFARYAEILKTIDHPHVATVFETGAHGEDRFIARERVPGFDLRSLIELHGQLASDVAIQIVEQAASALGELRRGGLLDAYLTPRNVLVGSLTESPHAYVADLGLIPARPKSGILPPEASRGVRDDRSDVYALGALLRGELTGVLAGESTDTPPWTQTLARRRAEIPAALERVLTRALREDPAERYATPVTLLRAVHRAADPNVDTPIRLTFSDAPLARRAPPRPSGRARPDGGGEGIGRVPGRATGRMPGGRAGASSGMSSGRRGGGDGGPPAHSRSPAGEGEPPRSAFALLYAPESVLAGEAFELEVGLSPRPDRRLVGDEKLERPADSRGPYTLAIHVVAPDFKLRRGESWRNELEVTLADPYPRLVLHVAAKAVRARWKPRVIQATYSTGGQTMGLAVRPIGVARAQELVSEAKPRELALTSAMPTDSEWPAPDLTINILRTDLKHPDSLEWTFESPHEVVLPGAQPSPLGASPEDFAKLVYEGIPSRKGKRAYRFVLGSGRKVTEKVPKCLWPLLEEIAKLADGPPTVLINSADPYVPWELAALERPLDDDLPPFLGAQAVIARWVMGTYRPPREAPCPKCPATSMSIVSGVYEDPALQRLRAAEEEAEELSNDYGGSPVEALLDPVMDCLDAKPVSDLVHFAMHARWRVGGYRNGLVMTNGEVLEATELEGIALKPPPFVFLNACQAGAGDQLLGDYAGLAVAFLRVGAAGVIAPLWAVDDKIAKDVATRFYSEVFDAGALVAEYLRGERSAFRDNVKDLSTTRLAYVFYGHPAMMLRAERALAGGG